MGVCRGHLLCDFDLAILLLVAREMTSLIQVLGSYHHDSLSVNE